jgi:hypothetical protein
LELESVCHRYTVVPATLDHARAMAPIMRPGDRGEIWAAAALDPLAGLQISLAASLYAWTWLVEDVPACIFGVSAAPDNSGSNMNDVGIPWLLSSGIVDRHWLPFLKHYRPFLEQMRADFPVLANWVDARYTAAIRWLRWMGFEILAAEPYGPFGLPHHRFELRGFDLRNAVRA